MSWLQLLGIIAGQGFIAFLWYWTGYSAAQRHAKELREWARYRETMAKVIGS